jgi:hypothetical protein
MEAENWRRKEQKETREHIHESQTFFGAILSRFFFT